MTIHHAATYLGDVLPTSTSLRKPEEFRKRQEYVTTVHTTHLTDQNNRVVLSTPTRLVRYLEVHDWESVAD